MIKGKQWIEHSSLYCTCFVGKLCLFPCSTAMVGDVLWVNTSKKKLLSVWNLIWTNFNFLNTDYQIWKIMDEYMSWLSLVNVTIIYIRYYDVCFPPSVPTSSDMKMSQSRAPKWPPAERLGLNGPSFLECVPASRPIATANLVTNLNES